MSGTSHTHGSSASATPTHDSCSIDAHASQSADRAAADTTATTIWPDKGLEPPTSSMPWLPDVITWPLAAFELVVPRPGPSVPVDSVGVTLAIGRAISADIDLTGGPTFCWRHEMEPIAAAP